MCSNNLLFYVSVWLKSLCQQKDMIKLHNTWCDCPLVWSINYNKSDNISIILSDHGEGLQMIWRCCGEAGRPWTSWWWWNRLSTPGASNDTISRSIAPPARPALPFFADLWKIFTLSIHMMDLYNPILKGHNLCQHGHSLIYPAPKSFSTEARGAWWGPCPGSDQNLPAQNPTEGADPVSQGPARLGQNTLDFVVCVPVCVCVLQRNCLCQYLFNSVWVCAQARVFVCVFLSSCPMCVYAHLWVHA